MSLRHTLPALLAAALSIFPASAQQSGITAETWSNLGTGKSILLLRDKGISARAPDTSAVLGTASLTGLPAGTGVRLRGTLTPLVDDNYTFWVTGASNVALWVSEDGSRFTKRLIASNLEPSGATEWEKHPGQRSIPIALTAGVRYHIEAHVMSGAASGHLALAWRGQKGSWALAANGATATQSTTQWNAHASRAIDGNTSGVWSKAEPTLTTNQQNSWLKVDFAGDRPVNRVVLHNNAQNQDRLSNFRISLLDAAGNTLTSGDFFTTSGHVGNSFAWDLPAVVQAASVKIQLLGNNLAGNGHLSLAEVQAFHNPPPPANWALASNGSAATQSSTSGTANASLATDGDDQTFTLTEDQPGSWLEIDLGQDRPVNRVILRNNPQTPTRLSNFRVSLLDAANGVLASGDFFTTTGNAGPVHYWNLPTTHQARKIRIELLGQNLDGNGHLSLAEVQAYETDPVHESRDFQVISSAYLGAIAADPADLNDNHLPDDFEQQSGLTTSNLPGALLEFGDPDNDGISNYDEHRYGSNPLLAESLADVLTRSVWTEHTSGSTLLSFIGDRARFLSYPNETALVAGIDATLVRKNFGARYRGSFIAPATGTYRFWLCASGDAQLWIADGSVRHPITGESLTDRFGKRMLATSGHVTPLRDFDYSPAQRTPALSLVQGQEYYIEVLHKVAQGSLDHVSVAWQAPGQTRAIMPAEAFRAIAPHPADYDSDNLPDSWETANGLNPANNGLTSTADGEYGDPDLDGLTNLQEFQYGTNPFSADTDGDGYSDYDEIFLYGSNPLVSNNLAPASLTLPPLNQYSAATGGWTSEANGSLSAWDRRGAITYTFTVTEPGVHEVAVSAGAISSDPWVTKSLPLTLSLDGDPPFASKTLSSKNSLPDTIRAITPWLSAGTHTLTVFNHNVLTAVRMRIDSVTVKRLGGADLNEDGVPDWIAANEAAANALTRVPAESRTSPASIEGVTRQISSASLTILPPGAQQPDAVALSASINNGFYADVPLSADGAVTLNASFLGGVVTESRSLTWIATNLLEFDQSTLHIRKGDSLRLTAHDPSEAPTGTFTLSGNHPALPSGALDAANPHILLSEIAGTFTLTATHGAQTATVTLVVHSADFGPAHIVHVGIPRTWSPPTLGPDALVEADERLVFTETTVSGARKFHVIHRQAANHHVIARIPSALEGAPSAILARGTVHSFRIANVDETRDAQVITQYADGTWLMHSTLVAINLPAGVVIRITLTNQGSLFENGGTVLELRAEDFDADGVADIYYEWVGVGDPKLCHTTKIFLEP